MVSHLIDHIEPNCFKSLDETAFAELFPHITALLYEDDDGFKHNNKKMERKFKRVAKKLWENGICSPEF